jgi:hypothetical protein
VSNVLFIVKKNVLNVQEFILYIKIKANCNAIYSETKKIENEKKEQKISKKTYI